MDQYPIDAPSLETIGPSTADPYRLPVRDSVEVTDDDLYGPSHRQPIIQDTVAAKTTDRNGSVIAPVPVKRDRDARTRTLGWFMLAVAIGATIGAGLAERKQPTSEDPNDWLYALAIFALMGAIRLTTFWLPKLIPALNRPSSGSVDTTGRPLQDS